MPCIDSGHGEASKERSINAPPLTVSCTSDVGGASRWTVSGGTYLAISCEARVLDRREISVAAHRDPDPRFGTDPGQGILRTV